MGGFSRIGLRDRTRLKRFDSTVENLFPLNFSGSGAWPYMKGWTAAAAVGTPKAYIDTAGICYMVSATGTESHMLYTGHNIKDGFVECTASKAQDSGLILRWQDNSNYYMMTMSDDSGSDPNTNLRVFSSVAGSFSLLGSYNTAWANGTTKRCRLQCVGTTINAYMDDMATPVISVTNASIAGPGYCGLRSNQPNEANNYLTFRFGAI